MSDSDSSKMGATMHEVVQMRIERDALKDGLKALLSGKYEDYFIDKKCPHCEGNHYKSEQPGRECYGDPDCGFEKKQVYIKMLLGEEA